MESNSTLINEFQINLFKALLNSDKNSNLIFSPLSIFIALSLTTNGAAGVTKEEMLNVLGSDLEKINESCKKMISTLKSKENDDVNNFNIANAIFTKVTPTENFKNISESLFSSTTDKLESLEQVNNWCSQQTKGKIPKILEQLSENDMMVILNAVYFLGKWQKKFKAANTMSDHIFTLKSGKTQKVKAMKENLSINYYEDSNMQVAELPYQMDNMVAYVILPKTDIDSFTDGLSSQNLTQIFSSTVEPNFIKLVLPKFKIESSLILKDALVKLGMVTCFNENAADFSQMTSGTELFIGAVVHKAFINVDEDGTEAGAVTAVVMMTRCRPMQPQVEMIVNRPFLFILKEKTLDTCLFIAKIESI